MKPAKSLRSIVARRILLFAVLASVLEICVVFADYWFDEGELGRLLIEHETVRIADAYRASLRDHAPFPDPALSERYELEGSAAAREKGSAVKRREEEAVAPGYFLRVMLAEGKVLYSNCGDECNEHFLPLDLNPPSFWDRMIEPVKPLTVAGGRTFSGEDVEASPLIVDFASVADPARLVNNVLFGEMVDHMIVPMGLMLFLVIGASILSIGQALRPVAEAARAADAMEPRSMGSELPTAALPREIADLTRAVNRALARVGELVRSQKLFAAAIAHEIRTPVAIVKLELERIDHPRARRAERDLDNLTHTLEQLTALARLDAVEGEAFSHRSLASLALDTVEQLAPLVYASGRSIELRVDQDVEIDVVPALIVILIRNLVENAVKHTRPGTAITVSVDAPAVLSVTDTGDGFAMSERPADKEVGAVRQSGSLGLGLKIAERIAALHGGSICIASTNGCGTSVRVDLVPKRS